MRQENDHIDIHPKVVVEKVINLTLLSKDHTLTFSYRKLKLGWSSPPNGFMKLNVDAVIFFDFQQMEIGAILRDSKGNYVMAASMAETNTFNSMTVEAMAIIKGLQLCMHIDFSHLIIESDCKVVINSILQREDPMSKIENLVCDIKEWMRKFQDCSIQFVH